ncbi:hypothetical protein ABN028_09500 [Actinopolymorpha sp. B17G11]|uniref:hypothetical protein n=1 Tax=Actinopolymorpha sp. B17G11 TaxID=3160861 RepID=UPI0032E4D731
MAVHSEDAYDATCDTCDTTFSATAGLVGTVGEFRDYGWLVDDTNALCPACARREGAAA